MRAKLGCIHPKTGFLQLVHWWVLGPTGPHGPDTNNGEELVTISTHGSKKESAVDRMGSKANALATAFFSSSSFLQQIFWFSHRGNQ
jgi:hypothetical protein